MARLPKYRLEVLLRIKERLKKRAEMELARALKKLLEEQEALRRFEQELEEIIEKWNTGRLEMKSSFDGGPLVGKGNVHVDYLRGIKEDEAAKRKEIDEQKEQVVQAETKVAAARRNYIDACKELQIMEKHKELWQKKMRGELGKLEARKLDELGNAIHQLKRWRGEKSVFEV